jgi:hypothetical protein
MRDPPVLLDMAAEYVALNAKSGEPEGLPDLARAAYRDTLAAVKQAKRKKVRKEHTFFGRPTPGT